MPRNQTQFGANPFPVHIEIDDDNTQWLVVNGDRRRLLDEQLYDLDELFLNVQLIAVRLVPWLISYGDAPSRSRIPDDHTIQRFVELFSCLNLDDQAMWFEEHMQTVIKADLEQSSKTGGKKRDDQPQPAQPDVDPGPTSCGPAEPGDAGVDSNPGK